MGCFWVTCCLCKLYIDLQPSRLELTTLPRTLWAGLGRINSLHHSVDCHLMSNVPSLTKKKIFWIAVRHAASAINSNTTKSDIAQNNGIVCLVNITMNRFYYTFACCLHGLWNLKEKYVGLYTTPNRGICVLVLFLGGGWTPLDRASQTREKRARFACERARNCLVSRLRIYSSVAVVSLPSSVLGGK